LKRGKCVEEGRGKRNVNKKGQGKTIRGLIGREEVHRKEKRTRFCRGKTRRRRT
jgi:hypothetical protein